MYKALSYFKDLQDNGYTYRRGDSYPRKGYEPTKERIKELATDKNKRHVPVIVEINDNKPKQAEETEEVKEVPTDFMNPPTEATEQPKKKGRKKKDA